MDRRVVTAPGLVVGALAALAVASASTSAATYDAPAPQVTLTGTGGAGPVALREVSVGQAGNELVVRIATATPWDAKALRVGTRPGRRICVSTFAPAETRLCLEWRDGRLKARRALIGLTGRTDRWRTVKTTIGRPNQRTVQIRGALASFGVTTGPIAWAVRTSWDETAECAKAGACDSRLPLTGYGAYTARQAVSSGCLASGPTVVTRGLRSGRRIALTFDDGPSAYTPQYLDLLKRYAVPATFFVLGQNVAGRKGTLQRMAREGHVVANHSWSHPNVSGGGQGQIGVTNDAIRSAIGVAPCLFRPPYGARSSILDGQLRSLGMLDVLWTVDTNDWQMPGASVIASRVINGAVPGAIVLMHDGGGPRGPGLAALPRIITTLRARGYEFVTVPQLLGLRERVRYR